MASRAVLHVRIFASYKNLAVCLDKMGMVWMVVGMVEVRIIFRNNIEFVQLGLEI